MHLVGWISDLHGRMLERLNCGISRESAASSLSLVIVCYDSLIKSKESLRFLCRSGSSLCFSKIILVNNSHHDAEQIRAVAETFDCKLIQASANCGYGTACNIGFAQVTTDFVAFMNPDLLVSAASLATLKNELELNAAVVAVGPAIRDGGRVRNLKVKSAADPGKWTVRPWGHWRLPSYGVRYLPGCPMMVRSSAFRQVGGFDEGFFLYFEDDDLSIRLSAIGDLRRVETAVALHTHGESSSCRARLRGHLAWHLGYSMVRAQRKHRVSTWKIFSTLEIIKRGLSPLNSLSKRYRSKTLTMVAGALTAMSSNPQSVGG